MIVFPKLLLLHSLYRMKVLFKIIFLSFLSVCLTGCASLGKGMVEAFLEKQASEDTRLCEIWGKPFDGLAPYLDNLRGKMKVLMVHGVGDHLPGYATQFVEKLAQELDLPVMSAQKKNITLTSIYDNKKNLGNLSIVRLLSKDRAKELMFYELTWSAITAQQKEVLAYDNSGEYSFRQGGNQQPDEKNSPMIPALTRSFIWARAGKISWSHLSRLFVG